MHKTAHLCTAELAGSAECSIAGQNLNLLYHRSPFICCWHMAITGLKAKRYFNMTELFSWTFLMGEQGKGASPLETCWYLGRRKLPWGSLVRSAAQTSHEEWRQIFNENRWPGAELMPPFVAKPFFTVGSCNAFSSVQKGSRVPSTETRVN